MESKKIDYALFRDNEIVRQNLVNKAGSQEHGMNVLNILPLSSDRFLSIIWVPTGIPQLLSHTLAGDKGIN